MKTFAQWLEEPEIAGLDLSARELQIARLGWTSALLARSDDDVAATEQRLKDLAA